LLLVRSHPGTDDGVPAPRPHVGEDSLDPNLNTGCKEVISPSMSAPRSLSEGLRPSDSPTRALARRFARALRSRGSLRCARSHPGDARTASVPSRHAHLHRVAHVVSYPRGFRPSASPTRALARRFARALRSRGSLRCAHSHPGDARPASVPSRHAHLHRVAHVVLYPRGFAPRTPLHALSRAASPARSVS